APQDVEWAIADGRIWILQSRPVVGAAPSAPFPVTWESQSDARSFWRLEGSPGDPIPYPIEQDIKDASARARLDAAHLTGRINDRGELQANQSVVFNGRRYVRAAPTKLREGDRTVRALAAADLGVRL